MPQQNTLKSHLLKPAFFSAEAFWKQALDARLYSERTLHFRKSFAGSQAQLADKLKCNVSAVQRHERGIELKLGTPLANFRRGLKSIAREFVGPREAEEIVRWVLEERWPARGSPLRPPNEKASNVAEPKPEEPPKPLQQQSSSPVSVPLLRPLEDLNEAEEKFRKRLRKHGLDRENARSAVWKLYSKAAGRALDWKLRAESGWVLQVQVYDSVQSVLSRWSGLVDETIHQAFAHLPYEQGNRPKLELINEASDWESRLRSLVDLAFEEAI